MKPAFDLDSYLHDIGADPMGRPKLKDPHMEPPKVPPIDRQPRPHDVVAWRRDGRIDATKHADKTLAVAYGEALPWIIYDQWCLMCGRDMLEKHAIGIPAGMAIGDDGLPYATG